MRRILSIEAFREVTLATWDDHIEGAERLRFSSAFYAESYLRRFVADPGAEASLRCLIELAPTPSLGGDDLDDILRVAGERVFEKRLKVYERALTKYFSDIPIGPSKPDKPDEPDDPDDPVEPAYAKPSPAVTPPARWELDAAVDAAEDNDCFDLSTLHLKAKLVEGKALTPKAIFTVLRNGGVVATGEVSTAGDASFDWEIARVRDDEDAWTLEFRFKYEDDTYTGNRVFTVWPRTVRLEARHFRTDEPTKGFRFTVEQGAGPQVAETGDGGVIDHPLAKPAPFTVSSEAPFVVKEWTRNVGRVRRAKVVRLYKAEFHAPKKPSPDKAIEQYVNLKTAADGRDGMGSKVLILVGAEGDADRPENARVGTAGDEIYVKVLFDKKSKRNAPATWASGLSDAKTVDLFTSGKVTLGAHGGAATIGLDLGLAGATTCTVSIGVTPEARDQTITFVTWRKLFYQATRPDTMALPSLARMTAALEELFVRYEKYKELPFTEADSPPAGAWFDGPMMGLPAGRCVCIGDHNKAHFHTKFDDTKNPVGVHLLLCHTQFDGGSPAHGSVVADTIAKATHAKVPFPPGAAATVWCHELDISTVNGKANVFPKAIQDGADAVRSVTWTSLAAAGAHAGKSGTVPADHVHVDWVNNRDLITIKLPVDAAAIIDAGERVRINYTVLWALGEFLGESDGKRPNLQLIAQLSNDSTNDVMAHELGHTMGAVLKAVPPGLVASDHGWKYTGRGHQGPHCAFGAPAATFNDASKNLTGLGAVCKCIMYGANRKPASNSNGRFCEKCRPFLVAEALQDITK